MKKKKKNKPFDWYLKTLKVKNCLEISKISKIIKSAVKSPTILRGQTKLAKLSETLIFESDW